MIIENDFVVVEFKVGDPTALAREPTGLADVCTLPIGPYPRFQIRKPPIQQISVSKLPLF